MGAGAAAGAGRRSFAFVTDDLSVAGARPSASVASPLCLGEASRIKWMTMNKINLLLQHQ